MAAVSKRSARGTDGGRIAALPAELLHEVVSRVGGVKDLFMLAVTCRWWLRLFTDRSFLRGLFPGQGHRTRLLGFFPRRTEDNVSSIVVRMRAAQRTSVSPPTFLPASGSPFGPTERALTSFVAADDGTFKFNYAQPLAARRGIVLMQLVPRIFNLNDDRVIDTCPLLLGLFNPTTCKRLVLPHLECSCGRRWCVNGYAIITAADGHDLDGSSPLPSPPSGRFTFSQLLLIASRQGYYQRYLHSYSAATRRWGGAPTACLDGSRLSLVGEGPAAVHGGAAHWLCIDPKASRRGAPRGDPRLCKLSVGLGGTAHVSLAKLPIRAGGTPLLHVNRDGKLSVACVYPIHVTVWTQQDGGGEDDAWVRTQVFLTPAVLASPKDSPWLQQWSLDRGSVLVLGRSGGVFLLDLEKEVVEKVMDCIPRLCVGKEHRRLVPYEMDLVEFFVSRLGGLLC